MRFPRNAKIFRGRLELAPFINVLFVLVIFIVLGTLLYTPGIPFQLEGGLHPAQTLQKTLTIAQNGDIVFEGKTNRVEELGQLRAEFKKLPPQSMVVVKADPAAPREIVLHVRDQAKDLPILLETADRVIDLPVADGFSGTPNRTVVVAVSFGGQLFYENRLINENALKTELQAAVKNSAEPLTLLVLADKSVLNEVITRLATLARQTGIKEMIQVTRPPGK